MTRRRVRWCKEGCGRQARKRQYALYCSPCWQKAGRPQRECSVCHESFSRDTMLGTRCRPCVSTANHAKRVHKTYGLEPGQYELLLAAQDGKCFICRRKAGAKRLSVDHDHACCAGPVSCGKCVRGLLDKACNRFLGYIRDDANAAYRMADYLVYPPARRVLNREA